MRYVVSYDLVKYQDYPKLWGALEKIRARRVLRSVWTLSTDSSTTEVRDYLRGFIDSDDRLVVFRYDHWATYGALTEPH